MRQAIGVALLSLVSWIPGEAVRAGVPITFRFVDSVGLIFEPSGDWDRARLAVGGPGGYRFERRYAAPEAIVFDGADPSGYTLPDGFYRWELSLSSGTRIPRVSHSGFSVAGGRIERAAEGLGFETQDGPRVTGGPIEPVLTELGDIRASGGLVSGSISEAGTSGQLSLVGGGNVATVLRALFGGLALQSLVSGAGGATLWLDDDSSVGVNTILPEAMLHVAGSGIVEGDFRAGSSRDIKKNLEAAKAAELLARLTELEIFTWSYKDDPSESLHVGPLAEDFYRRFGFGHDDKHISPSDTAGLALAAIQGLQKVVQEQQAEIAELRELVLAQQAGAGGVK